MAESIKSITEYAKENFEVSNNEAETVAKEIYYNYCTEDITPMDLENMIDEVLYEMDQGESVAY